jgi:uncharacterized protein (DUF4415 family)
MKKRTSSKVSKTDWKRLRAMKEHQIKLSKEHPQLDITHVARTLVRKGLRPVPPKTSLALRVDADVVEWFKAQGRGYQTRMNAVLRAFKEASI